MLKILNFTTSVSHSGFTPEFQAWYKASIMTGTKPLVCPTVH